MPAWTWIDPEKNQSCLVETSVEIAREGRLFWMDVLRDVDHKAVAEEKAFQTIADLIARGPAWWIPPEVLAQVRAALGLEGTHEERHAAAQALAAQGYDALRVALALEAKRLRDRGDLVLARACRDVCLGLRGQPFEHDAPLEVPAREPMALAEIVAQAAHYRLDRARLEFDLVERRDVVLHVAAPARWTAEESSMRAVVDGIFSYWNGMHGRGTNDYGSGWDDDPWIPVGISVRPLTVEEASRELDEGARPSGAPSAIWIVRGGGIRFVPRAALVEAARGTS